MRTKVSSIILEVPAIELQIQVAAHLKVAQKLSVIILPLVRRAGNGSEPLTLQLQSVRRGRGGLSRKP